MGVILKLENISKQYRLGLVGSGTIGEDINRWWHRVIGKEDPYIKIGSVNDRTSEADGNYVWALQDINFSVEEGEVLGIIGKNGAGKSTLLKILSKVTAPTTGEIKTRGRIASLLEVGTGFHPELTGRENIYLNGAILGMTKSEISDKEAEIIEFSGCLGYIDTPVKRYSSGMRVRLAFAVAAHLEPDILVIDEVLAVGDAEFQKKAIGKMQDISRGEGRTVLFVSHNMASVQHLCSRVILLENGKISMDDVTDKVIDYYLKNYREINLSIELLERTDRKGKGQLKFKDFWLENINGEKIQAFQSGSNINLCLSILNTTNFTFHNPRISVGIDNNKAVRIAVLDSELTGFKLNVEPNQETSIRINIPKLPLNMGEYYYTLFISEKDSIEDWVINAGSFSVEAGDFFSNGNVISKGQGDFLVSHNFIGN